MALLLPLVLPRVLIVLASLLLLAACCSVASFRWCGLHPADAPFAALPPRTQRLAVQALAEPTGQCSLDVLVCCHR